MVQGLDSVAKDSIVAYGNGTNLMTQLNSCTYRLVWILLDSGYAIVLNSPIFLTDTLKAVDAADDSIQH